MNRFKLYLSPPDEAGSGGAASGGGGIPEGPAPAALPEQQPGVVAPTEPDLLPEDFWTKHVPYETASGRKTAPVKELAEGYRRQNVTINNILNEKKRLEEELAYQRSMMQQLPPPPEPQYQPPPVEPYYGAEDDTIKQLFDFVKKQQADLDSIKQERQTRAQQEQAAAQQARIQQEAAYHTNLLQGQMAKHPELKDDPDAWVSILTEYNRLHSPDLNPEGYQTARYNPDATASDAVRNYVQRWSTRVDSAARQRLERIRGELEKNKDAAVAGGGGLAPIPSPGDQKITDWSSEATLKRYRDRFKQAKAEAAFGKT